MNVIIMSVLVRRKRLQECDGGMSVGVGNPAPAQTTAMTAVDQSSASCIGSGDSFGSQVGPIATKKKTYRLRRKKS